MNIAQDREAHLKGLHLCVGNAVLQRKIEFFFEKFQAFEESGEALVRPAVVE